MLNRFIPSEEIRLSRAKTVETQDVNRIERKEYLKENFNYDWVQKMPLDMVREFHKHLDYESRTMELLSKHPFIMSIADNTLADIFTARQVEKIFQEGFVKKLVETTGHVRKCRSEVVDLLPKQQTTCYLDLQGHMKSHTPARHPVLLDIMKFVRSPHIFRNSRPIRKAIICLMKTTTFIVPFDNFLRRTAYQLVSSIIIYKDTVMKARIQRENALKLKAEARRQAAILKSEARNQARNARNARIEARNARNARIEARNADRKAKVDAAKNAKAERKAERDAMILAEKETKLVIRAEAKALKVQEKEAAKAAKVQEKEAAKATKVQEKEAAKAAKVQEKEAAKAAKAAKVQEKEAAKALKIQEKEAAKALKMQEKEAAKALKMQEKEAAKAAKMQEKEAAKALKMQEKEAAKEQKKLLKK